MNKTFSLSSKKKTNSLDTVKPIENNTVESKNIEESDIMETSETSSVTEPQPKEETNMVNETSSNETQAIEETPVMSNETTELQQEESITEIEPLIKPIEPPKETITPEIKQKTSVEDSSKEEEIYSKLPEPVSTRLKNYKLRMMPGKTHHGDTSIKEQLSLYRAIQTILRAQGSDFFKYLNAFLNFIHLHRDTLFNEKYAMRDFDKIRLNDKERKGFSRILYLFIITSDRQVRKQALKQVDLETILSPFSEEVKEKITEFYSM